MFARRGDALIREQQSKGNSTVYTLQPGFVKFWW
jgi:hypothetical protein